jgi:histidine ammonia-lyase
MALVLIGEGEADYQGERLPGAQALLRAGIDLLTLGAKEGLSLVNGTQLMLAIGCLELHAAETLADTADAVCALTLDSLRGTPRAFDPRIHEVRPQTGQVVSAKRLSRFLEGSEIRASHLHCRRVQDAYSLRCAPQVHGAVRDAIAEARRVFQIELNSATDNPLVFDEEIISGGNFHGEPLALQLDYLAVALAVLAGISERRIDRLVNPYLNESLPAFLAEHPGLESGMMMLQVTAAALVAENRVLATPASPGSITTSGNKEDFVSMGVTAANKLREVVRNTRNVLAIEALCATRGMEFLKPLRTSQELETVRDRLRPLVDARDDRPWSDAIAGVSHWIADGAFRLP